MKKKYFYYDNKGPRKLIFTCDSCDIIDADVQYERHMGSDPAKQPFVSCTIFSANEEDDDGDITEHV
jgi:hypothetical protein